MSTLTIAHRFPTQHEDILHDVSYDFYGKRLATCSSDHRIKVWDLNADEQWECTADWKAHQGSIWKVCWAHPEFGQVLASCSFDRTVSIWEEPEIRNRDRTQWTPRCSLVDSRSSVQDIKFAPHHWGPKLVTCSADGRVRLYEAPDVMNLEHWPLMEEFETLRGGARGTCVDWNKSRTDPQMLVVGSDDGTVRIWEFSDTYRRWQVAEETLGGHKEAVHDVAWAPNIGRDFHLIAAASKDRTVCIWKVRSEGGQQRRLEVTQVACLDTHKSDVWRVEWNVTGTVLASSGDDGTIRLWKANDLGTWTCTGILSGDE